MKRWLPITLIFVADIGIQALRLEMSEGRLARFGRTPNDGRRTRQKTAMAVILSVALLCLALTAFAQTRTLLPKLVPTVGHTNKIASVALPDYEINICIVAVFGGPVDSDST